MNSTTTSTLKFFARSRVASNFIFSACVASACVTSSALAMPKVGDEATFDVQQAFSGHTAHYTLEFKLTAYDAAKDTYTETITSSDAKMRFPDKVLTAASMASDDRVNKLLADCTGAGKALEEITVKAGTFKTCKVTKADMNQTNSYNVASVPFGIVRSETMGSNGSHVTAELIKFQAGN